MLPSNEREAAVWRALAAVNDPELDELVVDLGFIVAIAVDGEAVDVAFRLPTFWCSAGFAWIMADDMREAVDRLGWVKRADIRLVDHFAAERINAGVANRRGFREAFGTEAVGDLAALRETFRRKAYLGRMSAVIAAFRKEGKPDEAIAAMRMSDLRKPSAEPTLMAIISRYLELRGAHGGPAEDSNAAFRTPEGEDIVPDRLQAYLRDIRMTRRSVEANGEMCRILLKARSATTVPELALAPAMRRR